MQRLIWSLLNVRPLTQCLLMHATAALNIYLVSSYDSMPYVTHLSYSKTLPKNITVMMHKKPLMN